MKKVLAVQFLSWFRPIEYGDLIVTRVLPVLQGILRFSILPAFPYSPADCGCHLLKTHLERRGQSLHGSG